MDIVPAIPAPEFKEIIAWANSKPLLVKDQGKGCSIRLLDTYMHLLSTYYSHNETPATKIFKIWISDNPGTFCRISICKRYSKYSKCIIAL